MTPHSLRRRLVSHDGQAMAITMLVLLVTMGLAYAAFGAVDSDISGSKRDTDEKRAYAAAQAGIADYVQKLENDNDYWVKCTNVPKPDPTKPQLAPVNQLWTGAGTDQRVWRPVPSDASAAYTIELVPAAPAKTCVENDENTMLTKEGTLRIKTTGRAGVTGKQVKRSIITTVRRRGFLDFIYFTDFETGDPTQLIIQTNETPVKRCRRPAGSPVTTVPPCGDDNLATWADQDSTCRQYRTATNGGRATVRYPGSRYYQPDNRWYDADETSWASIRCSLIQFAPNDAIRGPFHSNDTIYVCEQPDFGRNRAGATNLPIDRIEHWGVIQACGASSAPDYGNNEAIVGEPAGRLQLPETNTKLKATAEDNGYVFEGRTRIELSSGVIRVNGVDMAYPANGLIYVKNAVSPACSPTDVMRPYTAAPSCGDAYVVGTYGANLTITAERDVVVSGDVVRSSGSAYLLGLIANNFVRVEHHMRDDAQKCAGQANQNDDDDGKDRTIQAAMLSLGHVFTVDNYQCGNKLGNLNVLGAIGQKYRGPVGTSNSSGGTGYIKNYVYDDRLKFRSPPFFLPPVQSAWKVLRSTEQSPAV